LLGHHYIWDSAGCNPLPSGCDRDPSSFRDDYTARGWRIEDAFNIAKRLLGLAYFWNGSQQGIRLQIWATWILYAILVDLVDDVAEALDRPFADISIEMVYRSLYYFAQAYQRGEADDLVAYLVDNADILGIVKRRRKRSTAKFLYLTNPSGP
jgi:hypothetical protein